MTCSLSQEILLQKEFTYQNVNKIEPRIGTKSSNWEVIGIIQAKDGKDPDNRDGYEKCF